MSEILNLPQQQLPFKRKNKKWRKQIVDWADSKTFFNSNPVRNTIIHKKINYDLMNGKIHMQDLEMLVNPENQSAGYIPESIQHYPIMNSKLNVLRGEESKRVFDFRVVVTNPNSISEIENAKKEEVFQRVKQLMADKAQSEEELNQELDRMSDFFTYEWQDLREVRANALLNHYVKEYNIPLMFNEGFMDAMTVGEEIYHCDIIGGEPTIERVNPLKIRVFKSGYSNRIEDADMIVLEDYWSPGKIIDTYYDVLTKKDIEYIENLPSLGQAATDSMGNIDERMGFVSGTMIGDEITIGENFFWDPLGGADGISSSLMPYDTLGNVRILRVFWKSRRRIKKVKSYDPETGEEIFNFYPETYIVNKDMGEEEENLYINEAWEGTKIGESIYVNMRPRVIQYNRLSNPSRCHFGIVGSIYNLNDSKPFSLVDMMKKYNYLYDVVHDRLNKMMAKNWGKILRLDLARVPKGWTVEKWMYYAKANGIAVEDSFREGNYGAATGKVVGAMNNASTGYIDAEFGNSIQSQINLLEFIKMEMSDVAGISRQREGQISNRETVGGVERATLQSSHITEYLFIHHDDVKKRALECFLETAKIALKGRSKKFQYILADSSMRIMEVDGDEFADSDYGLLVDNSQGAQELAQKIDMLAQAALQNQTLSFGTIMKLYNSCSLAEKQRIVENNERQIQERNQQAQQQQLQVQQQEAQMRQQVEMSKMEQEDRLNERDNETKIIVAQINAQARQNDNSNDDNDGIQEPMSEEAREKLRESIRQFDARLDLDKQRLQVEKDRIKTDAEIRRKQIAKQNYKKS